MNDLRFSEKHALSVAFRDWRERKKNLDGYMLSDGAINSFTFLEESGLLNTSQVRKFLKSGA